MVWLVSSSGKSNGRAITRKPLPGRVRARGQVGADSEATPIKSGVKVLVVDDDQLFLNLLEISAERLSVDMDLRVLKTNREKNHVAQTLREYVGKNWIPDLVVVDINIAEGGHSGETYVESIRKDPGFSTIPLVLTTSSEARRNSTPLVNSKMDRQSQDPNWIQPFPISEAPDRYHDLDIQAVLYGKTGDKEYLLTLHRLIDSWQTAARRQTWTGVIQQSIEKLNDGEFTLQGFAEWLLQFAAPRVGADHAFLRMVNESSGELEVRARVNGDWVRKIQSASAGTIPILDETSKSPQYRIALSAKEAGEVLASDLVGMSFLGTPLLHEGELVGVMTLTRDKTRPCFRSWELGHLTNLGQQLASVFGRENQIRSDAILQTDLLDFGAQLQKYPDSDSICAALARQAHERLHGPTRRTRLPKLLRSKTTVRLIDRGTDVISRRGTVGDDLGPGPSIKLSDNSVIADVCRRGVTRRIADVTKEPDHVRAAPWVQSELCVPIKIGEHPLGVLNLEHESVDRYLDVDQGVAESFANLAAQVLSHQRQRRFVSESISWMTAAHKLSTEKLWNRLESVLFEFCDYGCLLYLELDSAVDAADFNPWKVMRCHRPRNGGMEAMNMIVGWQELIDQHWKETLLFRIAKQERMREVFYTEDKDEFFNSKHMLGAEQKADAYIPLIHSESGQVIGALLLLWFQPPTFSSGELKETLGRFGRYCVELVTHQSEWEVRQNRFALDEQQRMVGAATLWLAHTYTRLLMNLDAIREELSNHLALVLPRDEVVTNYVAELAHGLAELQDELNSTIGFVREPEIITADIELCVDQALTAFQVDTRDNVEVVKDYGERRVRADTHILKHMLGIIVGNALWFVSPNKSDNPPRILIETRSAGGRVFIRIADSGPGVSEDAQKVLFLRKYSSEGTSGVGLLLAKERASAMGGNLRLLAARDPERLGGATFEIELPES